MGINGCGDVWWQLPSHKHPCPLSTGTRAEVRNKSPILLAQDLGSTPLLCTSPFSEGLKKCSGNSKLKGPTLNINSAPDTVPTYPLFLWLAGSPAD